MGKNEAHEAMMSKKESLINEPKDDNPDTQEYQVQNMSQMMATAVNNEDEH